MENLITIFAAAAALILGVFGGRALEVRRARAARRTAEDEAAGVLEAASSEADNLRRAAELQGKEEGYRLKQELLEEAEQRRAEIEKIEKRLSEKEEGLERKLDVLDQRQERVAQREEEAGLRRDELKTAQEQLKSDRAQLTGRLEKIAGLTAKEARAELVSRIEDEAKAEASRTVRDIRERARREAEREARKIISMSIQRLAVDHSSEITVSVVPLPSDDMKGRIIGREGRNIRAFEATTGVNIIVDDTPEAVALSTFDPVRREVARRALERLVEDGRIHPASIEDAYEKAFAEVEQSVRDAGEWAILEVRLGRVHPELVNLLGRLKYRLSYGQNVLHHLIESAKVAGMLAGEVGADADEARRAAFLHDIGKAVSHELGGSHALVGAEIARRFGEDPAVVHGIEAHHNEVEPRTLTAVIVQAADAVSAARPGARREAVESFVRRLESLEEIAMSFSGVLRAFAMQAGREVRVVVDPGEVDDLGAHDLARQLSRRFEADLQYPGQIQVTVIRELRATDYAR